MRKWDESAKDTNIEVRQGFLQQAEAVTIAILRLLTIRNSRRSSGE